MTDSQKNAARALNKCSFLPGSWDKKFAQSMCDRAELVEQVAPTIPVKPLTDKQHGRLANLVHKYRKQIPDHDRLLRNLRAEMQPKHG